jgi:hypothetical protein
VRAITIVLGAALAALCVCHDGYPAWAQAGIERPSYQVRRFDEDWSVLRGVDTSRTDDVWDRLKFIPLTSDQSVWLTLGGQVRERVEYYGHFLFGASLPKDSDGYLLSRFRLSADLHVTPYVRLFAEGTSAFALDRELLGGRTTSYVDEFELRNGFADVVIPLGDEAAVTLRGGRHQLLFGSQRMVGPGDFTQIPRTFDGGSGIAGIAGWTLTGFWTQPVITDKYRFNESSSDRTLFGVFGSGPALPGPVHLDLYWLAVDNAGASFNGTTGRERRHTLGGRVWGKIAAAALDFELEGAAQFGTIGQRDIAAAMTTVVVGYTLPVPRLTPHVYLEFDWASGDGKRGGDVGTFNQLYPNGHSFLGYIDYIGRQNIVSASGGVSLSPLRGLTLSLQQYFFWRDSDHDAIYNKSGAVLRPGTGTTARYVGAELDLLATHVFTRHLLGYAGYSRFFTGEFIDKTGPARDSDFFYVALQYTL